MRYLVLGINGMAGHTVGLYLAKKGNDVVGFGRKQSAFIPTIVGDALKTEMLLEHISSSKYDVIVNCLGILNSAAENDKPNACFINALLPHLLVKCANQGNSQVVHLSTDCVFSGKRGKYREDDLRDGETFYDRTKALGEIEDERHLTLRTSIIGPDLNPQGIGLLNWFMNQPGAVTGYTKSIWTGQTTLQLAKTIEYACERKISGLYNIVPNSIINKFQLLSLFNKYFKEGMTHVKPIPGPKVDKSLIRTRNLLDCVIPDYEIMISELADWMKQHKALYPHYKLI